MPRAVGRVLRRGGRLRRRLISQRPTAPRPAGRAMLRRARTVRIPLMRRRPAAPAVYAESPPVAPVAAPELSLEDPLVRATRAELRRFVGQRVQLVLAAGGVPEITPWDTDGTLVAVGDSLITLRPGHGPNAGAELRLSLQGLLGFIPLTGMDPQAPRWQEK